jgi:hypothetical protein
MIPLACYHDNMLSYFFLFLKTSHTDRLPTFYTRHYSSIRDSSYMTRAAGLFLENLKKKWRLLTPGVTWGGGHSSPPPPLPNQ